MDAAGAQTLPAIVSTLDQSESLANAAQVSHPLAQKLHSQCSRSLAFREDENSKLIDFIRPDGVTGSSQRSDETIRHEQDGLPHKSGLQSAVKESKQFGTESAAATYLFRPAYVTVYESRHSAQALRR